jgi:hypothetical protein
MRMLMNVKETILRWIYRPTFTILWGNWLTWILMIRISTPGNFPRGLCGKEYFFKTYGSKWELIIRYKLFHVEWLHV